MAVEVVPAVVVSAGGAGVGVAGGVLDVLEWDAGGEGFGDEGVAEAVGCDLGGCGDAGVAGQSLDHLESGGVGEFCGAVVVEEQPSGRWVVVVEVGV